MLAIEERLFDEYKRVDKLCREIFSSQSGVTQYITKMEERASYGRSVIPSWNDDYYTLKRVRWLRNKIAHESGATECNENDAAWLEDFHRRLLERQDSLALLREVDRRRSSFPHQHKNIPKLSAMECDKDNAAWMAELRSQLLEQQHPLSLFEEDNQERAGFSCQRKSVSKTVSEQSAGINTHLRERKKSSLKKRVVIALIVCVEVLIILAAVTIILIYR
ncbi:MAG: hypothetical protein K2J73_13025 [Oscillospiraceae bacterium]|nr:hypothetical protein [Oscillospiraceae bacterium]